MAAPAAPAKRAPSMSTELVTSISAEGSVATLELNRPDACNALNGDLIARLTEEIVAIGRSPTVRVVILTGNGPNFCAGTDIQWIEQLGRAEIDTDAKRLANLLSHIRSCPKPVIAKINGNSAGAGVGLIAAADIAVTEDSALFSLPAIRLGMIPSVIMPFVTEAIGLRHARRYALTGEAFDASEARRIGLAHAVCIAAHLDQTVNRIVGEIVCGGPDAITETKSFMTEHCARSLTPALLKEAWKASGRLRTADEACEGLRAFLEKRLPRWRRSK